MARTVHSIKQRLALAQLIQAKYTDSRMKDKAFAALATKELGFNCEDHHVRYLRGEFDIPANDSAVNDANTILDRLARLEQEMSELRCKLADLLK